MNAIILDLETCPIDDVLTYLPPVSAPSNYKDVEKIAEYIVEKTLEAADRAALKPDLCRIVCLGYLVSGTKEPVMHVCKDEHAEKVALTKLAQHINTHGCDVITFNGHRFDLPVIMRRALYLGVSMKALSVDRYRSTHIDLFQKLTFNGQIDGFSLSFYAQRFGLGGDLEVSGKEIPAMVKAMEWDAIARHCRQDILWTAGIAKKLGVWDGVAQDTTLADAVGF
jgi:DNA polymerase elongation subunit (family B)